VLTATGALGEPGQGAATTLDVSVPVLDLTKYSEALNYWGIGTLPDWGTVTGYLALAGVVQSVDNNAYGVDIEFQEAYVSPDWEFLATSGGSSSSGSGAVVQTYHYNKASAIDVASTASPGQEVNALVTPDLPAGVYEIGYSFNMTFSAKDKTAFFQLTGTFPDAEAFGEEAPSTTANHKNRYYMYPVVWPGGIMTIGHNFWKESGYTLTVDFSDLIVKKVG